MSSALKLKKDVISHYNRKMKLQAGAETSARDSVAAKKQTPWIVIPRPKPDAAMRVFCLPYAGGSPAVFQTWADFFEDTNVEICLIHLPGRDSRMMDKMPDNFYILVQQLMKALSPYIMEKPYVVYGHCMGSLISFELFQQLRNKGLPLPRHFFVGAHYAPSLLHPSTKPVSHLKHLSLEEFFQIADDLGGTEGAILSDPTTGALIATTLSADYFAYGDYEYRPEKQFEFPITVYLGLKDNLVKVEEARGWEKETTSECRFFELQNGYHFFVLQDKDSLLPMLKVEFKAVLESQSTAAVEAETVSR